MSKSVEDLLKKLSPGDIILYRGDSFLSRSIRYFMDKYRKKLGLNKRILYNHAAMIVDYKGNIYVAEANSRGIEVNPFEKSYGKKLNKIKIITPKKPYSKAEKSKVSDIAIQDAFNPTRYDFINFWYQIRMILSTKVKDGKIIKQWRGPKGSKAEKRLYCTEAVATWANDVRVNTFNDQFSINPLDIELNTKYYKVLYNGVEEREIS